ncbi:MAG: hypothetical protein Kow00121_59050 [Elainellaceae cyanobacterium]
MKTSPRMLNQIYTTDSLLNLWSTNSRHQFFLEQECPNDINSTNQADNHVSRKAYFLEVLLTITLLGFALWIWIPESTQPSSMTNTPQTNLEKEPISVAPIWSRDLSWLSLIR